MNKEQIFDEAYDTYNKEIIHQREIQKEEVNRLRSQGKLVRVSLIELLSKEQFINRIKTDSEFSEKWGLKIEERELSLDERDDLFDKQYKSSDKKGLEYEIEINKNLPTKLITITYNGETIESYE